MVSRGEGSGEGAHTTLMSLYPDGCGGTVTSPGVWLCNKPMDLSACVSEVRGHEEGGDVYGTLMSDTLHPNGRSGTDTRVWAWGGWGYVCYSAVRYTTVKCQ